MKTKKKKLKEQKQEERIEKRRNDARLNYPVDYRIYLAMKYKEFI